jgi:hypothetical protein
MSTSDWILDIGGKIAIAAVLGGLLYKIMENKRFALRLIDLVSYILTIAALIGGMFALIRFITDLSEPASFGELALEADRIEKSVHDEINKICGPTSDLGKSAAQSDPLASDCTTLWAYRMDLVLDARRRASLNLTGPVEITEVPKLQSTQNAALQNFKAIEAKIADYNTKVSEFRTNKRWSTIKRYRMNKRILYLVSFSFGLGVLRRGIDAVTDYKRGP